MWPCLSGSSSISPPPPTPACLSTHVPRTKVFWVQWAAICTPSACYSCGELWNTAGGTGSSGLLGCAPTDSVAFEHSPSPPNTYTHSSQCLLSQTSPAILCSHHQGSIEHLHRYPVIVGRQQPKLLPPNRTLDSWPALTGWQRSWKLQSETSSFLITSHRAAHLGVNSGVPELGWAG